MHAKTKAVRIKQARSGRKNQIKLFKIRTLNDIFLICVRNELFVKIDILVFHLRQK